MPCDDNKAPSWKSGRKTKEKNWNPDIWNPGQLEPDVMLSPTLRVFIRRMIWTFTLGRNSFCVRFVTLPDLKLISFKSERLLSRLDVFTYSHLSNERDVTLTDFGKFHPAQNKNAPCSWFHYKTFNILTEANEDFSHGNFSYKSLF